MGLTPLNARTFGAMLKECAQARHHMELIGWRCSWPSLISENPRVRAFPRCALYARLDLA